MKKVILSVISMLVGASVGATVVEKKNLDANNKMKAMSDKHLALFLMMNQWVKVKQSGKGLFEYFKRNSYKKIAIYGMSYAGETLLEELADTGIEVAYAIDQKADGIYADIDVFSLEDELDKVDVVVVTAITFFDEIEEKLSNKVECPIISLEDILYEI